MFKIMRNNKRFNNKKFATYEEARSYVRKWIRKNVVFTWADYPDINWAKYNNPSIKYYNFNIKAI